MKYKGTYRLKAEVDQGTNDFPRDENGNIDASYDDIFIKCPNGAQIYHYGSSTLVAYIPSVARGHNILKGIAKDLSLPECKTYEELYKSLKTEGTVRNIVESDAEIEFMFHAKNLEKMAVYLKPFTGGADISPFSTKNLPKSSYLIPEEDLKKYTDILSEMPQKDYLLISRITKDFISNILAKSKQYRSIDMKADMKKKMLKGKEYIHSLGEWDRYIKYLKEEIKI